jgi:hypothetical protein
MESRRKYCPGFIIPSLDCLHYDEYNATGPKPDREYNPISLKVNTKICTHANCQPHAEYEYALIDLYAKKEITQEQWADSRPPYKIHYHGIDSSKRQPWCFGNMLKPRPIDVDGADVVRESLSPTIGFHVDPDTFQPYTDWCKHENDEACLNSCSALLSLTVLTARGIVPRLALIEIRNNGWATKLEAEVRAGRDPDKYIFAGSRAGSALRHLWYPTDAQDYGEKEMTAGKNKLDEAPEGQLVYLEDLNRIKCNYRQINDDLYVYLRKRNGFLIFEMREIPDVIQKLSKMWSVTGGGTECLHDIADKSSALSLQYKKRKPSNDEYTRF